MHIYFSGIGGSGIGPLALIAKKAGYEVSGSDIKDSQYIAYLRQHGITDINIGQTSEQIVATHAKKPIDWLVYTSFLPRTSPDHAELEFVKEKGIRNSARDELLNEILSQKKLKLIAIAGTHGKTTTTAMVIWLFGQLGVKTSHSVGAKISFADMGHFEEGSEYFVYECDEFDRNFLAFHPYLSLITGLAWDHHEIFPTIDDYKHAFRDFIDQSQWTILWQREMDFLELKPSNNIFALDTSDEKIDDIKLPGRFNREDAWLAVQGVAEATNESQEKLIEIIEKFPGVSRRFEKIAENLYTDYAHTPEKIQGCMSVANEVARRTDQKIVVIYEPLTNRRMHYTAPAHKDVFKGASAIYWVPSFLAREDPNQPVLTPAELIKKLNYDLQQLAKPMELDGNLDAAIRQHLEAGDLVVAMSGGGAGSLDEWLRAEFG